jgi:hypothetical protein
LFRKQWGDARSRRKGDTVARAQAMELAVDPGIGLTLDDIDELLVQFMGVGLGATAPGRNRLEIDPEPAEAEATPERGQQCEEITMARRLLDLRVMPDETRALRS